LKAFRIKAIVVAGEELSILHPNDFEYLQIPVKDYEGE